MPNSPWKYLAWMAALFATPIYCLCVTITAEATIEGARIVNQPLLELTPFRQPASFLLELEVQADGSVGEARVISGERSLRQHVLTAARQWRVVSSGSLPATLTAYLYIRQQAAAGERPKAPVPPPPPFGATVTRIEFVDVERQDALLLAQRLPAKEGKPLSEEEFLRTKRMLADLPAPLAVRMTINARNQIVLRISPR